MVSFCVLGWIIFPISAAERSLDRSISVPDDPLVENLNRLEVEGEARSVDAAIGVLRYVMAKSHQLYYDTFSLTVK